MVFDSIPSYLDPANWQPQPNHHQTASSGASTQFLPPPPPPPPQPNHVDPNTVRPSSMADRARMANMSMPETALKCPRCDSSNTKFCYFNNYSLSQPRHFCKTCRRYWTRGGALRNVPVGGGCRRNKRTKSGSSSKAPTNGEVGSSSTSAATPTNSTASSDFLGGLTSQLVQPPMRFNMSQFHHQISEFGIGENIMALNNYGGISVPQSSGDLNFLLAHNNTSSSSGSGAGIINTHQLLSGENHNLDQSQWRIIPQMQQQFPFLAAGFDPPSRLLHNRLEGGSSERPISYLGDDTMRDVLQLNKVSPVPPVLSQLGLVKFEGRQNQEVNLSRQFAGHDQLYWNNNGGSSASASAWTTDLSSGFNNSSSTASHTL